MLNPTILLFQPKLAGAKNDNRIRQLQAHGFTVVTYSCLRDLYRGVQAKAAQVGRLLVLLAGQQHDNCIAASYLRTLCPAIGILALVSDNNEGVSLQLMQSGVDVYCRQDTSFELLLAITLRLFARTGADAPVSAMTPLPATDAQPINEAGYWQLQERGWVLAGPQEQRIPLTTGERAFMVALLSQPGLRAEHKLLIAEVNSSYAPASADMRHGRLGLLVSRLRRKFRAHGTAEAPLKSLHGWGYMFTGPVYP